MQIIRSKFWFVLVGLILVMGQLVIKSSSTIRAESFAGGGYPSVDKADGVWHFQFTADKWQAFSIPITEGLTYNFIKDYCPSLVSAYGMHDGGGYYLLESGDTLWPDNGYWILFDSDCPLNFPGADYYYQPKTLEPNVIYAIGAESKSNVLDNKKGTCGSLELQTLDATGAFVITPDDLLVNGFAYWLKNTSSESCVFAADILGTKPDLVITDMALSRDLKVGDHFIEGYVTVKNQGGVKAEFKQLANKTGYYTIPVVTAYLNGAPGTTDSLKVALSGPAAGGDTGSVINAGESKKYIFATYQEEAIYTRTDFLGASGRKTIYFLVDEDNLVDESNENNNSLAKNIYLDTASPACSDSDGGKDYYTKGKASGLYGGVSGFSDDYCSTGGKDSQGNPVNLTEFYCLDGSNYGAIGYFCPNGCQNGACIQNSTKPVIEDIQTSGLGFDSLSVTWQAYGAYNCSIAYSKNADLSNGTSILYTNRTQSSKAGYYYYWANVNGLLPLTKYYYKIICSTSENNFSESGILDFTTKSDGGQYYKPDLIVSDFSWSPVNPLVNQDVTMTVSIKNIGEAQVSEKFWVTVAHNRDSEIVSDIVGGYKEERDVAAGGVITKSFKTKFTGTGSFAYTVLIPDTDKERIYNNETYLPLNESSTANNSLSKTISVAAGDSALCTDSDGGANYHTKGVCTDASGAHEDKCVAVDASGRTNKCLTEYYCNKSTQRCDKAKGGEFECAFGCSENACIMKNEGITIPVAGEYYFKMNWYSAAENTTISLVSPKELKIAQYYGKYPPVQAPQSLGVFRKGDNLLVSLKSSWWNTFYGPVYSSDPLNFKIETIDAAHWKFTFEGPLRWDKNYNDGSFEIYRKTGQPVPAVTDSDGGKDYYQKGVCRSEMNNYLPEEDKCLGDTNVLEFFPSTYNDGRGICGSEVYACPNGCGDGVCLLAATTTKPDFIVQNIRIAQDSRDDKYYVYVKFRNIGGQAEAKTLTLETADTASGQKYYANNGAGEVLTTGEARELPSYESLKTNTSGIYNLISKVDFNEVFAESDETNNTLTKTVKTETLIIVEQKPGSEVELLRERIKKLELKISELERQVVETEKRLTRNINAALAHRVKGEIFLQVEENGEAWYVDPVTEQRFYLKDGESAYRALQAFGLGISDANLRKIPIGLEEHAERSDSDGDGLDDRLEEAIGTDKNKPDTDGDGFNDGEEIKNAFNPVGAGNVTTDANIANSLDGRIVLQVQNRGQAWYIHDGKRYYLKDGDLAYQIMRFLSNGITNNDLRQIGVGALE